MDFVNDRADERPVTTTQAPDAWSRPDSTAAYQPGDMLALEMGLRAASRLTPTRLAQFRSNIEKIIARNPSRYLRGWKRAIEDGPDAVRYLLTDRSDRGQVMRSVISFRPFVSKEERDALFRADAADVEKRHSIER
jgi:hypothetical protein